MMSEKRFSVGIRRKDNEVFYSFFDGDNPLDLDNIVDLLNEQQATIKQLESDKAIAEDYANIFEKENVKLRRENKELQEEIKLLKPVNVEQYEQIVQLQEENEQLRQQLKWKREEIKTLLEEDNNDVSFIGNWTDKPVILERKPHRIRKEVRR